MKNLRSLAVASLSLTLLPLLTAGCPCGPEEPMSASEWSDLASKTEEVAEHIYQHNQTDLEFLERSASSAFGPGFTTAKSWNEVASSFPAAWQAGKQEWIQELRRLGDAFEEHSALASIAAIFQSRAALDEVRANARYGSGPDFDLKVDDQDYLVDRAGRDTQAAVNDRLKSAGPKDGWPLFSAIDDLFLPASQGRDMAEGTLILARELAERGAPLAELAPLAALVGPQPFEGDGFSPIYEENGHEVSNPLYEGITLENDPFAPGNIASIRTVTERMVETAEALANGTLAEGMASMNMQFLALQNAVEMEQRRFQTLSNASKARHDIAMNSIRNMK